MGFDEIRNDPNKFRISFCLKHFKDAIKLQSGPGSSVGIATDYGLDGPGIESR